MPERDQRLFLADIVEAIEKIERYTKGMGLENLLSDTKTMDAVVRNLEIIGEAVKNLDAKIIKAHPEVDWKGIAGMRDRLTHGYFGVDPKIVWETIQNKTPDLKNKIQNILNKLE
ncbi:MAG: DUF86 domain-containing protein [Methanobacteriota archaeon]|nr:MAG: DUF86 domain-containing protein [Euryarchaeota archaeon]